MNYPYNDPLLKSLVKTSDEDSAMASIATYGDFSDANLEILVPLRAYILVCIANMKASDDLFSAKLKAFQREFDNALAVARTKSKVGVQQSCFSVGIARG